MAKDSSTIWLFCYTTSPYTRVQTTLNQGFDLIPESFPFCTGGKRPLGDGDLFYLDGVASADPIAYNQLVPVGTTQQSHSVTNTCVEQTQLLHAFVTNAGVPHYGGNLTGLWAFNLECRETSMGSGCPSHNKRIYAKIDVLEDPLDRYLGQTGKALPGAAVGFRKVSWPASGSIMATDRLVVKVYAEWEEIVVLT